MVGLWAAEKLGLTGAAAEAYAKDMYGRHEHRAATRWSARSQGFRCQGGLQSDHQIRRTMEELMAKAMTEINAGL